MNAKLKFILFIIFVFFQACMAMQYTGTSTIINVSNSLDSKEVAYQEKHTPIASAALRNFLGMTGMLDMKMPKVSMCFSGGGVRAQTATIGILAGAQIIGLLEGINSIAALSGSAWAIIPWILHQMSPLQYSDLLRQQVQEDFWDVKDLRADKTQKMISRIQTEMTNNVRARISLGVVPAMYKFGFSELWGQLIARRLIYDIETNISRPLTFKDIRRILRVDHSYPFPIFTTIIAETSPIYEGFEITPYTSYSKYLRAGISTKYFGSTFDAGFCTQRIPEKTLAFYMGIIGSAYTVSPGDAIIHLLQDLSDSLQVEDTFITHVKSKLQYFLKKISAFSPRSFDVKIPNFVYNIPSHKMHDKKAFHLLDYGIHFNLPIFPFTRKERGPDVLIIGDASSDASDCDFTQLKSALVFAEKHNMRFPSLKKFKDVADNLKIFYEDDAAIPVVIYIANTTKAFTLDMNYSPEQFDSIFLPMFLSISEEANKQAIIDAIKFKTSQINKVDIPNNFFALKDGKAKKYECVLL